ncbi:MAG: PhzF family phenazine biosynthesis protein [Pseudomonadota bacterium]
MVHPYQIYDVFTDTVLEGNPLAVVFDADDLDGSAMQRIAGEFNLSETIFFHAPDNPGYTTGARIFTPAGELPFAGHPTVGGAVAFAARRGSRDDALVIELPAGPVACSVELSGGTGSTAFDAPIVPKILDDRIDGAAVAETLGLAPGDIGFDGFVPTSATSGPSFSIVPIAEAERLAHIALDRSRLRETFGPSGDGVYCIAPTGPATFQARMFAPLHGIEEDPATGSAAAAFAVLLAKLRDGTHSYKIRQGLEMGRPSLIDLTVEAKDGSPSRVRLSGQAVRVASGELAV